MFYAIDYEALQNASARRIPLADLLSDDTDLIPDLLAEASGETARDLAQTLLLNQGFEDLTKKSLIARFIKKFPTIQSLIAGEATESSEEEGLIVSQASFDAAKEEYEDLITKKIPENKEAIAVAREHGDLKENSEYKMARQDQDILLSRRTSSKSTSPAPALPTSPMSPTNSLVSVVWSNSRKVPVARHAATPSLVPGTPIRTTISFLTRHRLHSSCLVRRKAKLLPPRSAAMKKTGRFLRSPAGWTRSKFASNSFKQRRSVWGAFFVVRNPPLLWGILNLRL